MRPDLKTRETLTRAHTRARGALARGRCDGLQLNAALTARKARYALAAAWALAQAHWKLYPPSQPVTSTHSPMK